MKLSILTRKLHYWAAILIAMPLLVVIVTGILLQMKKQIPWVQPREQRRPGREPVLPFSQILNACRSVPEAEIRGWDDIDRIDVRPGKGLLKVQAKNRWEIQVDSTTGEVLQVAFRRSDLIESIHDGSWFHDRAKLWLFLPAAGVLLMMWLTGLYLFWLPIVVKARRKGRASPATSAALE